jgi:hypothetical protein
MNVAQNVPKTAGIGDIIKSALAPLAALLLGEFHLRHTIM